MPVLRSALDCLGPVIVIVSTVTGALAYTRVVYPPAVQTAAVPWLDPAVTGAITKRAARSPVADQTALQSESEPARGDVDAALRAWVDPPPYEFDFPLRGSI